MIEDGTRPIRVLVVEDEPLVRRAIGLGLVVEGIQFEEAGDGAACLTALAEGHFDVVVLDLGLPDVDGVDLAAELRRRSGQGLIIVPVAGRSRRGSKHSTSGRTIIWSSRLTLQNWRRVSAA